jgi:hypothetical protein
MEKKRSNDDRPRKHNQWSRRNTILHPEHIPSEENVMDREDLTQHQDVLLPISALEILLPLPTLLTLAALANPALSS